MSERINKIKGALQDRYGDMGGEDQDVIDFFETQLKLVKFGANVLKHIVKTSNEKHSSMFDSALHLFDGECELVGKRLWHDPIYRYKPGIKEAVEELTK